MENKQISQATQEQRKFIVQVYMWMTLALLTTAVIALFSANSSSFCEIFWENSSLPFILLITEFLIVAGLSKMINKISSAAAIILFFVYAILNGLTFSSIFIVYDLGSISTVFFITAGAFAFMCIYGYFTQSDLSSIGNLCLMGLVGILIASVVNIFMHNSSLDMIICIIGVFVFVGLTAYDTQKIKRMSISVSYSGDMEIRAKGSIIGALELYLDFMNLFLYLLRLFAKKR